ncbi:energy transducer TonB [Sandaracinobacter neustonicus]|nr:energy transducer TonB [Sandaracinobacter neustonicus]
MRLHPSDRKAIALTAVILLHIALFALLLRPILVQIAPPESALILLDIPNPPPPPPEPEAEKPGTPEPEAAAAPPAPRAKPKPVAAPPPIVKPEPKPSPVAPAPSTGMESQSGAATAGPGTGASGAGFGAGAGGAGTGQGGGGGTRARWKSGSLTRKDLPADLRRTGVTGSVSVHLAITPEGRATDCRITRSSGLPALDQLTCRLIEQRFRYTPAKDSAGNPIASVAGWRQDWWLEPPVG